MSAAGRAVTGAGFAAIMGGFFTILVYILPLRQRPFYCGILGGVKSVAVITAPIFGGVLNSITQLAVVFLGQYTHWRRYISDDYIIIPGSKAK